MERRSSTLSHPSVFDRASLPSGGWLRILALLLAAAGVAIVVGSPIFGWFPVVRFSAVAVPVLAAGIVAATPWRWTDGDWDRAAAWAPSRGDLAGAAGIAVALLFWIVYSRFEAGGINAVDFTIYFDRPLYQTSLGNWYLVESTDDARFDYLTHLAVHAYWILLPLAGLYYLAATPIWLLALSVVAVVAGSIHISRIVRLGGGSGLLASATALAFLLNDNTARTLNYGFHAEVLYAWFIPWAIDAGLRRARLSFALAVIASVLVKEDALFPLLALSCALAFVQGRQMSRTERLFFLVVPPLLAFANLALYYAFVVPAISPQGDVMYSYFWSSHGPTPWHAAAGMLRHPVGLVSGALTSGFFAVVLARHLFLPLAGWRWIIGLAPLVVLYGASDNDQVRAFGIYYAVPLVPFLVIGGAQGARVLTGLVLSPARAEAAAAAIVVASALAIGLGYSLRPWKPELREVRAALQRLAAHDVVLVQSGLYPHAGYDPRVQLLAEHSLRDPSLSSAVALLAPNASAYPFTRDELACLVALPEAAKMPQGLRAVHLSGASACLR